MALRLTRQAVNLGVSGYRPKETGGEAGIRNRAGRGSEAVTCSLGRRGVRRYLTSMKTTVSSKGQIVLPSELRQLDRIEPGEEFRVERLDRGEYRLRRTTPPNEGVVDWLLACPEKDFLARIESESTDTL